MSGCVRPLAQPRPSSHPGVGVVGLCGSVGGLSNQSALERFSGSVYREVYAGPGFPVLPEMFGCKIPVGLLAC